MSERIPWAIRQAVAQRAGFRCEYCLCPSAYCPDPFSIEHILPRAKGGTDEIANLAHACLGCNGSKYAHTSATDPMTGEIVSIFHPRRDVWNEHFSWDATCTILIGKTTLGRASIELLRLNRPGVVNLRRLLRSIDKHPPIVD